VPMIVESKILFDKTGEVTKYKESLNDIVPPSLSDEDQKFQVFMFLHINAKIKMYMEKQDFTQAAIAMHYALPDLMKRHYRLQRKWRVSDKRLLTDLKNWDSKLSGLVKKFVTESVIKAKFEIWKQMLEYVSKPFNANQDFEETNCDCKICRINLDQLNHE